MVLEETSKFLERVGFELLYDFFGKKWAVFERKFVVFFGITVLLKEFTFDFLDDIFILRSGDSSFSKSSKFL